MSLPFPQDTSVQLSYSSFPFLTPALDNYATSNYVISNSNILNTKINTKQDTLTAATNLLGVGSSISALDYNKITINKPSFFPADWGSTIANKPSLYTQTEVNNLLSAKEQILTFNSPLTRITNTIGINLNSYTPFSALLSSNFATYTGLNSCNYITNSTNSLTNYYNTSTSDGRYTQSNFTPSFTQLNSCNYITNSTNSLTNYYNKSTGDGRYTLSNFTPSFTQLNSCNYITNATTGLTNYTRTGLDGAYLLKSGGTMTGSLEITSLNQFLNFGIRLQDNLIRLWTDGTSTYGIGVNNSTLRYNTPTNTTHRFFTGNTNTLTIDGSGNLGIGITNPFASLSIGTPALASDGTLTISRNNAGNRNFKFGYDGSFNFCMGDFGNAVSGNTWRATDLTINWQTGNVGIGIVPQTQRLYVNGSSYINGAITATSFSGDGANITNVPYSTITGKPSIYTQSEITTFLSQKENVLTFNSPLTRTTNTIGIDLSSKENVLTFNSPLTRTTNTIGIDLSSKENVLTFNSPLTRTTNTIGINLNSYPTFTQLNSCNYASTGSFLALSGGTMSAGANIITTGNIRAGSLTAGETTYQLLIGPPSATTSSALQTILQGTGYNQNLTLQALGGNVGIGITNPQYKLHIRGSNPTILRVETSNNLPNEVSGIEFGIPAFTSAKSAKIISKTANGDVNNLEFYTSSGTSSSVKMSISGAGEMTAQILRLTTSASGNNVLYIKSTNTSANNCIQFQNDLNRTAYIGYGGSAFPGGGNYVNNLFIENANGSIILNSQGRTSLSTPNLQIRTDGVVETSSYIIAGTNGTTAQGLRIAGFDYGNTIYQDAITISGQPADIGFTLRNTNSFVFKSLTSPNYIEICKMNTNGFSIFGHLIQNYLFNNTGLVHSSTNDFNAITNFGYRFVQGNVNAPNTLYAQWYQWTIGLGINYPFSDFGAQFALPRNTNNPYLYVRYREGGTWGLWNSIRVVNADQALGLAGGNQTITGALSVTEYITCKLFSVDYVGYDDVGVLDVSGINQNNSKTLRQIWNSFTAFHRCFVDDELFNIDNPQEFKDDYMGRIVVSTGTIKTHSSKINENNEVEWEIKTGKEAIIIEDAHSTIELSRKKKDKRVLGVLGLNTRNNSSPERMIINSIGEGGIWVCNSNGSIENGDYITSSDYLGYGERQDDDILHNYTCAKATMDCSFELDSPLYQCKEIDDLDVNGNKLRVAFIAVTYHSG